jgi:hypothetical protein
MPYELATPVVNTESKSLDKAGRVVYVAGAALVAGYCGGVYTGYTLFASESEKQRIRQIMKLTAAVTALVALGGAYEASKLFRA